MLSGSDGEVDLGKPGQARGHGGMTGSARPLFDEGLDEARPLPFRGGVFLARTQRGTGALSLLILIALWQSASSAGWLSPIFAPSPAEGMRALWAMVVSGELAGHVASSLGRFLAGFAVGGSAGVAFGAAIGLSTVMRAPGATVVAALFPIPKIALLPLFILW